MVDLNIVISDMWKKCDRGSKKFFNRMVEALGITMDRRPKGRFHIRES